MSSHRDDANAEGRRVVGERPARADGARPGRDRVRRGGRVAGRLRPGEQLQRARAGHRAELAQIEREAGGGTACVCDLGWAWSESVRTASRLNCI